MGEVHVTRSCSLSSSLSSHLFFLLLIVFIQSYDVTQAVAYDVREFNNPFFRDQVYSPIIPPETPRTPQQPFLPTFQAVRSMPRYYVAGPVSEGRGLGGEQGGYVEMERGVSEYPSGPMLSQEEQEEAALTAAEDREIVERMMTQALPSQSFFSLTKRGPVEDFSVTNYKKNVNIPCNSKSPCKKPYDTSFQCKCPNMNQCWAPSAQHDATCKFASPPFGVMFYQP